MGHTHTPDIIVDPDPHFTINTTTRAITKAEDNKKVSLIQYDHNSERFSFDIDRMIEGHDILDCNRIQIHYINIDSSNRSKRIIGLYPVEDLTVHSKDSTKATFTWLISEQATQYTGTLSFLVSFSCVNEDETLYRWNSSIYSLITIAPGINNNNSVTEVYADELLKWENYIVDNLDALETELKNVTIPAIVDERYIEREFATSEEVAGIFSLSTDDVDLISVAPVVQKTGQATDKVMSQKAVSDELNKKSNATNLENGEGQGSVKMSKGNNSSKGAFAFATGYYASADAGSSYAGGYYSKSNVQYSIAYGISARTENDVLAAFGEYNNPTTGDVFEIGNGNSNSRSNAFAVLTDGRAKVKTAPKDNDDVVRLKEYKDLFGRGKGIIEDNPDLNNYYNVGNYYSYHIVQNSPVNESFGLIVTKPCSNVIQTFITNTGKIFSRYRDEASLYWHNWVQYATIDDIDTKAEKLTDNILRVISLTVAGGTLSADDFTFLKANPERVVLVFSDIPPKHTFHYQSLSFDDNMAVSSWHYERDDYYTSTYTGLAKYIVTIDSNGTYSSYGGYPTYMCQPVNRFVSIYGSSTTSGTFAADYLAILNENRENYIYHGNNKYHYNSVQADGQRVYVSVGDDNIKKIVVNMSTGAWSLSTTDIEPTAGESIEITNNKISWQPKIIEYGKSDWTADEIAAFVAHPERYFVSYNQTLASWQCNASTTGGVSPYYVAPFGGKTYRGCRINVTAKTTDNTVTFSVTEIDCAETPYEYFITPSNATEGTIVASVFSRLYNNQLAIIWLNSEKYYPMSKGNVANTYVFTCVSNDTVKRITIDYSTPSNITWALTTQEIGGGKLYRHDVTFTPNTSNEDLAAMDEIHVTIYSQSNAQIDTVEKYLNAAGDATVCAGISSSMVYDNGAAIGSMFGEYIAWIYKQQDVFVKQDTISSDVISNISDTVTEL